MTTPAPFEKVPRDEVPVRQRGREGEWKAACQAAIDDPTSAVVLRGLSKKSSHALRQQQTHPRSRFHTTVRIAIRKQDDGSYTAYITAVAS